MGAVHRTVVTAEDGSYLFGDLRPGSYTLTEKQPTGFFDGHSTVGALGGTVDHSQDSTTITGITVKDGDRDATGYHFAEIRPATASGLVWEDLDTDGVFDPDELGIDGVTITLSGTDSRGTAVNRSVLTDSTGEYLFTALRPGTYRVSEVQPSGYPDGADYLGTVDGNLQGDGTVSDLFAGLILAPASVAIDYNFSERSPVVTIDGRVFNDWDNDGLFEPEEGDSGIPGITVTLTGNDDLGAVLRATVTADNGMYSFDDVRPGTYALIEEQPLPLLDGKETTGNLGGTVDNTQESNAITDITITSGDPDGTGYNFAEIQPSIALGLVWQDFNSDAEVNFGEQAIEKVTISLNGIDDRGMAVNQQTQTEADGIYMFIDLRPGDYSISEVQPAALNDGSDIVGTVDGVQSGDNSVNDVISGLALPGSVAENYNFGERPITGGEVVAGQASGIGFWQNNNGQALIEELNGGATSTQLGEWLAATLAPQHVRRQRGYE